MQEIQHRHGQRRALRGICSRTELVEKTEAVGIRLLQDPHGIGHMRRERRQALLNALLVSDVRKNLLEHRQLRALEGRNEETGLAHKLEQSHGLQTNRLAAGIRSRDHQKRKRIAQIHRNGHHRLRINEGMPAVLDVNVVAVIKARLHGMHAARQLCPGEDEVQLRQQLRIPLNFTGIGIHRCRQCLQHLLDLPLLICLQLPDFVVQPHDADGLNKQGRARRALVMDHARKLRLVLRLHRKTVAAVPHGNDGFLQHLAGAVQYRAQLSVDPLLQHMHLLPHGMESGTGVIRDLILRQNAAGDLPVYLGQGLQLPEILAQRIPGIVLLLSVPAVRLRPGGHGQHAGNLQQLLNGKGCRKLQPLQGGVHVPYTGKADIAAKTDAVFSRLRLILHFLDFAAVRQRLQLPTETLSLLGMGVLRQSVQDLVKLQCLVYFFIHSPEPVLHIRRYPHRCRG